MILDSETNEVLELNLEKKLTLKMDMLGVA